MNLDHLTKLYDQLTPRERLPLIIAAGVRGDQAEQARLGASAPTERYQAPDYYRLAKALQEAVYLHLLTLLDLAAPFWRAWGLWNAFGLPTPEDARWRKRHRRKAEAEGSLGWRAHGICRYYAARFVAHVEGWKRFCSELHIDPEVPLHFKIGWETILCTEEFARCVAFTPEEAAKFVRIEPFAVEGEDSVGRGPVPVATAEDLAKDWHVSLDKLVDRY
jgi:hypothetical protein